MARVKRGTKRRARRKKYLKRTKGFFLTKSKLYQSAQEAANRADRYAFRDRRAKKRQYRRLWIQRIGAAARLNGMSYGQGIRAQARREKGLVSRTFSSLRVRLLVSLGGPAASRGSACVRCNLSVSYV